MYRWNATKNTFIVKLWEESYLTLILTYYKLGTLLIIL